MGIDGKGQKSFYEAIRQGRKRRKQIWKNWKSPFTSQAEIDRQQANIARKGLASNTSSAVSGNANNLGVNPERSRKDRQHGLS